MTKRRSEKAKEEKEPLLPLLPLVAAAVASFGTTLALRAYRDSQIFCPSPDPVKSWDPADYGIPPDAVEEQWIKTADGETLHAWYCRAADPMASALFCHGNTGNITISADMIPHLLAARMSVLFFDYRGFGKSSGRATVRGVLRDARTAAEFHDRIRPQTIPSLLYGFSLGGAVAAQLIRSHRYDALILQSTFTSLPRLTRLLHPRVPLHLLAGGLFDTAAVVKNLDVPLLVIHGSEDEVIPCDMAHELYDSCPSVKQIVRIEGGLHKDLYLREPETLVTALREFLSNLSGGDARRNVRQ